MTELITGRPACACGHYREADRKQCHACGEIASLTAELERTIKLSDEIEDQLNEAREAAIWMERRVVAREEDRKIWMKRWPWIDEDREVMG